jgi:hypothetical protein
MRITVTHNKTRQEAMKIIDESTDQLFAGVPGSPLQFTDKRKHWEGSTMHFSFMGRLGFFTAPLSGTVQVTDKDVTFDIVLPDFLKKFIPEEKIKTQVEGRARGLLTGASSTKPT